MADRVTQVPVEAIVQGMPNVRLTQESVESVVQGAPRVRLTYFAIEVMLPNEPVTAAARPQIWIIT